MNSNFIVFNNTRLNYYTCGKGSPLLLLHGFAENNSVWVNQIDFLKEHFFIIAPDLFGSGISEPLEGKDITLETYATSIRAIIQKENISKFHFFGHSMGGYIAMAYLEKFSADLLSLGLIHSTSFADDDAKKDTRRKAMSFILKNGSRAFLETSLPGLFHDPVFHRNTIDALLKQANNILPATLVQYYEAMLNRSDKSHLLTKTTIPLLFIAGKHDMAVPVLQTLKQSHLPPVSSICLLKNSGHMGMFEESDRINIIFAEFLTAVNKYFRL